MENSSQRWYMVTTISGREEQVIESLKNRVESENMQKDFDLENGFKLFLVPHISPRELTKKTAGEDYKVVKRNLFPKYILVKMNMTNEAWFMVRNTQYVTGLVGSSGDRAKPTPISPRKIKQMEEKVAKITEEFNDGKIRVPFKPGVVVEVIDGPTKGQRGTVLEVDTKNNVAIVELILFERKTETEISLGSLKIVYRYEKSKYY